MKNDLFNISHDILSQINCLRKITPNDKFPCFTCFDDKFLKINCKTCLGSGFILGSHPMVQFSQDFIQKKINYLKKQQQSKKLKEKGSLQNQNIHDSYNSRMQNIQKSRVEKSYNMDQQINTSRQINISRQINMGQETDKNNLNNKKQNKSIKNVSINLQNSQGCNSDFYNNDSIAKSHILSDSEQQQDENIKHHGYCCDICQQDPIIGYRYHCQSCQDYDLCSKCYRKGLHNHEFIIYKKTQGALRSSYIPKADSLLKNIRKSIRKIQ